jgi:hypothetical protein
MTGSGRNACNGLQRVVVAHSHRAPRPQPATGATPPIGALPVARPSARAPFVEQLVFSAATMKKPPRGICASRSGKWLLSPIGSASPSPATSLHVARRGRRPLMLPLSGPASLAPQALLLRPAGAPKSETRWPTSVTGPEIAREQAKRLADKYITRSGELVIPTHPKLPAFSEGAGARERGK